MTEYEVVIENSDDVDDKETEINKAIIEGDDVFYTSGDLSAVLGISRDMVRYYTNQFSEYLNVVKTKEGKGGHSRYRSEDLDTLRMIVALHEKHKTVAEIKTLLNVPGVNVLVNQTPDNEKSYAALLAQNNQYLLEAISQILLNQQSKYLTDKEFEDNNLRTEIHKLSDEVKQLKEICELQNDVIDNFVKKENEKSDKKGFFGFLKKN